MVSRDDARHLEAGSLVERRGGGVDGFHVGRHVLLIAFARHFCQLRGSEPRAVEMGLNADRR
jgi:hypothetical protein